jgi:hypothetical protein
LQYEPRAAKSRRGEGIEGPNLHLENNAVHNTNSVTKEGRRP